MARREPYWVKLFLRELERTGNVRLAAERAGVDFTTAYQRRKRYAEFAERWDVSLAAFRQRPLHHPADGPPPFASIPPAQPRRRSLEAGSARSGEDLAPPPLSCAERSPSPSKLGEDEVLRPDGKVIKGSDARWGKRAEEAFLVELTDCANVRRAAQAAGFSTTAIYQRRLKDRHFAAAWDAAIEAGKARLQAYLIEAADRTFDPQELEVPDGAPKVSVPDAISILKLKGGETASAAESGDGQWVSDEEYLAARERIMERLERLKERMEGMPRCPSCGQPMEEGA